MGYTLRAGIFGPKAVEQSWFRKYPIQATVLFRPTDSAFARIMREQFTRLDALTGDSLVFFTVLDPPEDWLEDAKEAASPARRSRASQPLEPTLSRDNLTLNDSAVVHEVARWLGVRWDDLPVLIASPDLWTGEFVIAGSDAGRILAQLEALTRLAVRSAPSPSIGEIQDELGTTARGGLLERRSRDESPSEPPEGERSSPSTPASATGRLTRSAEESQRRAARLEAALRHMESALREPLAWTESEAEATWRSLSADVGQVLARVRAESSRMEVRREALGGFLSGLRSEALAWLRRILPPRTRTSLEDEAGDLLLAATQARRHAPQLTVAPVGLPHGLDEESYVFLQQAHLLASFLRALNECAPGTLDLSPATLGIRKAMEKEVNRSLVQAARMARGIPMPDYFLKWCSEPINAMVDTGTDRYGLPRQVDLNAGPPLAHLTLGDALFVIHVMLKAPQTERLADILDETLGGSPLPPTVLPTVSSVNTACNRAVHAGAPPVSSQDFDDLWARALSHELLDPLCRLSSALAAGTRPSV